MKEEIKEILQELKEKNETYKECSENGIIENEYYKSHILLDYITNLQEENERLKLDKETIKRWYNLCKSRNEKAIEYIKDNLYYLVDNDDKNLLNILNGDDKDV